MVHPNRLAGVPAALLCALAIAGCGGSGDSGRKEEREAVRAAVLSFESAVQAKDYAKICSDLLAGKLLDDLRQIGLPCEQALRQGLGSVEAPTLEVRDIAVSGDTALASVHSVAEGQPPSDDALSLVREGGRWRIASLASPGGGGGGGETTGTTTGPAVTTLTTPEDGG